MKNKKINIFILLFLLIATTLFSQRIGFQAGGTLTGFHQQSMDSKTGDFPLIIGALGGPEIEFRLSEKYGINVAGLFEFRAGRNDISWYKPGTTYTRELFYAQAPIHLTYRKPWGKKAKLMYFSGPRLNVGLFGTTNEHYYLASRPQINDDTNFGGHNTLHRMDLVYDLGIGLEVQRFQFKLSYGFPLTNSANVSDLKYFGQHQLQLNVGITIKKFKDKKAKVSQETTPADSK